MGATLTDPLSPPPNRKALNELVDSFATCLAVAFGNDLTLVLYDRAGDGGTDLPRARTFSLPIIAVIAAVGSSGGVGGRMPTPGLP